MAAIVEKPKVKLDFNKSHTIYVNSKEQKIVGYSAALWVLNKPALIPWAYNRGREGLELYESRDKAADIGTIIHARIMAYFLEYEIDDCNISPETWKLTENSLGSFYEWVKPRNVKPMLIETPLISEKYQYGGTPDVYGEMDGQFTLLDFKTGSWIYDEHSLQLAAYSQLLTENGYNHTKCVILNIPKSSDDSFSIKSISSKNLKLEFKLFLKCVEIYYLQKEIKDRKKGGVI